MRERREERRERGERLDRIKSKSERATATDSTETGRPGQAGCSAFGVRYGQHGGRANHRRPMFPVPSGPASIVSTVWPAGMQGQFFVGLNDNQHYDLRTQM